MQECLQEPFSPYLAKAASAEPLARNATTDNVRSDLGAENLAFEAGSNCPKCPTNVGRFILPVPVDQRCTCRLRDLRRRVLLLKALLP